MEDPWANAWGEPSKSSLTNTALSPSWSAPSVSVLHGDNEDDLSTPSWPIKPSTQWNDPDVSEASLWSDDISTSAWNPPPSTFDRISLNADSVEDGSPSEAEPPMQNSISQGFREFNSPSPESITTGSRAAIPPRIETPLYSPVLPNSSHHSSPFVQPISIPAAEDVDGFGTFETAPHTAESAGWSPSNLPLSLPSADATAWGATWKEPGSGATDDTEEGVDDAWEVARQQKAKQDQHVPPELLASILRQLEELTRDLWPDPSPSTESEQETVDLEDLGLNSIKIRLVPEDLVLPMNIPFEKTFTTKRLSEALRLTRHSPSTRSSPMALYMSSKGSTSWEASIKAKPNITHDDITPAGWKVLEPVKEDTSLADEGKKKAGGGLLSFFGRRATHIPFEPATGSRPSSPATVPAIAAIKTGESPRASLDGIPGHSPVVGRFPPAVPILSSLSGTSVQPPKDSNSNLGIVPGNDNEDPAPAPSAVSRFLGRFSSRPKSSSSRDSIPLSADDLEFLSDVPTAACNEAQQKPGLDALSMMIKSPRLPTALPPPLSPPPKAPLSPPFSHFPPVQDQQRSSNDFSFFDDLETGAKSVTGSPLTTAPTPPAKPPLRQPALTSIMYSYPTNSVDITPTADHTQRPQDNEQSWPSFEYPSISMNKPAPSQAKRSFVPIMSSSRPSSDTPLPHPKPGSTFALPPPPSSRHRSSSSSPAGGSSTFISALPPPPSRAHTPLHPPKPQPTIIDEDDDFSDFLSSPSQGTLTVPLSFADFGPAPSRAPSASQPPTTSYNLLDDFMSSPPPPKPPAKTPPSSPKNMGPHLRPPSKPTQEVPKVSRKADHSRTLSLLETAAARGRWLAPPSPLPEALPPPDDTNGKSSDIGYFGGNSTMQTQQAHATATLAGFGPTLAVSSNGHGNPQGWNFPPLLNNPPVVPPTLKPPPPQPLFTGLHIPQPSRPQNRSALSSANKTGGLSAQDISFFEGL